MRLSKTFRDEDSIYCRPKGNLKLLSFFLKIIPNNNKEEKTNVAK
ncbi:hypothetical protein SAMN06298216_2275 [Spirosomataceae bacterium TFI 002]|nr:hypothetical protein SAMN06298216_2275 [Spirosomataceae bacterium TFI 002]